VASLFAIAQKVTKNAILFTIFSPCNLKLLNFKPTLIDKTTPLCYPLSRKELIQMTSIGERIYDLRNRNNMSQGALADKLDVSRQTISKWENNMCLPEAEKLLQLSEIFGVSIDYIMKGKPESQATPEPVYIYVKDPNNENKPKFDEKSIRKYSGILLAVIGGLLTIIFALESSLFILLTAPLTVLGLLLATNIKHPWLMAAWVIYVAFMFFSSYLTAINPFGIITYILYNIAHKSYFTDISINHILSLLAWFSLPILILCTIKAKRGYIFKKKQQNVG
jgi:transcriptional regulator with XRE-family HTH domain